MNGLLKIYSFPGKLISELWYLWPKKGQIWASGRRRDHGFVHFMYSTVLYLITYFVIAGASSERGAEAADETQAAALYSDDGDVYQDDYQSNSEQAIAAQRVEEVEAEAPEVEAAQSMIYEATPVVQDISPAEDASMEKAEGAE
ncbi:MAG: hypothetical protein ABIT10_12290 [Alteraurantiacibacter sp.]